LRTSYTHRDDKEEYGEGRATMPVASCKGGGENRWMRGWSRSSERLMEDKDVNECLLAVFIEWVRTTKNRTAG